VSDVLWYLGRKDVEAAVAKFGKGPATRLAHRYGRGTDADEIPTGLAYDKGALFLRTLEHAYGRAAFDRWLFGWFDRHAFGAVDSKMFAAEIEPLGTKVDVAQWLYEGGLPADAAPARSTRAEQLEQLAATQAELDATTWTTLDWTVYLRALPEQISARELEALDARYHLTTTSNAEIAMHWLPLVVRADLRSAAPAVEAYLSKVGRVRMVRPVYAAMMAGNAFWRERARAVFAQTRAKYHPITRAALADLVK
jgi:hypothetical protein